MHASEREDGDKARKMRGGDGTEETGGVVQGCKVVLIGQGWAAARRENRTIARPFNTTRE